MWCTLRWHRKLEGGNGGNMYVSTVHEQKWVGLSFGQDQVNV